MIPYSSSAWRAGIPCPWRLKPAQRLRQRHLIHHDLRLGERLLGDAVSGLDDGGLVRMGRGGDAGGLAEEIPDGHGVGGVVGALIDDLEHVVPAEDARGNLNPAGPPSAGHGHLAAGERHLIAGDGNGLEAAGSCVWSFRQDRRTHSASGASAQTSVVASRYPCRLPLGAQAADKGKDRPESPRNAAA